MEVHINDIVSTVRAVDSDSLLTSTVLERIVGLVLQAASDKEAHMQRVRAEQRITGGVSHELEEDA